MRSAETLVGLVRELVDDDDITDGAILGWINEALNLVAEKITPTTLMVPFSEFQVYANEESMELPDECVPEKILGAYDSERRQLKVHFRTNDAEEDFRLAPPEDSKIRAVLVMGNALRIIPKQTADTTIYLSYIKYPTVFSGMTDTGAAITFLPRGMAEKLVVNYAAAMAYRTIEDGVTDTRLNFKTYLAQAQEAFAEIELYFRPKSRQASPEFVHGDDFVEGRAASALLLISGGL